MRIFVLEDSHSRIVLFKEIFSDPTIDLTISADVTEAAVLFSGNYDLILLDHDLSDAHYQDFSITEGTGSEFAAFMAASFPPSTGPVVIHSFNPDGSERMFQTLSGAGWTVFKQPFGLVLLEKLRELVQNVLDNPPKS